MAIVMEPEMIFKLKITCFRNQRLLKADNTKQCKGQTPENKGDVW